MRLMALLATALLMAPGALQADDPPTIDHQPVPCTVPGKAIALCGAIADDAMVGAARVYFRPVKDKMFYYVNMAFQGLQYCATLPAPREGKARGIEYYLQATDDQYQTQRTSTYLLSIQPEASCGFPPVEKDPERAGAIQVFATHKKQGKKLPDEFDSMGVSFVPVAGR
jgi:hypothetical protein